MNIPPSYPPPSINSITPPSSRPSFPVRAGRAAKNRSPWILLGGVLIEVARMLINHFG